MPLKSILFLFLVIPFSFMLNAQVPSNDWIHSFGGVKYDKGGSLQIDSKKNIIVTGLFQDSVDFDVTDSIKKLTASSASNSFIQKSDSNGTLKWVIGLQLDIRSITLDKNDNIYAVGSFSGTIDFDPDTSSFTLSSRSGSVDGFLLKLDSIGKFIWVKQIRGQSTLSYSSVTIDGQDNILSTGEFFGSADFDPSITAASNKRSAGQGDIFIQKLDKNGDFLWVKTMGGLRADNGISIHTDKANNIYTIGDFSNTVDFDPNSGVENLNGSFNGSLFVQKLNKDGNYIWAKAFNSDAASSVNGSAIDASENVIICGSYFGSIDIDPDTTVVKTVNGNGGRDLFVVKLDSDGKLIWGKSYGGKSSDAATACISDGKNNIYITGFFGDSVHFDSTLTTASLVSNGSRDIFTLKLDSSGNYAWVNHLGSKELDEAAAIDIDATSNIYTTGFFKDSIDFNLDSGSFTISSNGIFDVYVQKLTQTSSIITTLKNIEKLNQSRIYPNPSNGNLFVEWDTRSSISAIIYDLSGKIVTQEHTIPSNNLMHIDLKSGLYILHLRSSDKDQKHKVFIK